MTQLDVLRTPVFVLIVISSIMSIVLCLRSFTVPSSSPCLQRQHLGSLSQELNHLSFLMQMGLPDIFLSLLIQKPEKKQYKCNICQVHVISGHLSHHQQAAVCDKKAKISMRRQNQNAELAQTAHALAQLSPSFCPQSELYDLTFNFIFLLKSFTLGLADLSCLALPSQSSKQTLASNENEQDQAITPTTGLTPHASFSSLMVEDVHGATKYQDQDLPPSSPPSSPPNQFYPLENDPFNDYNPNNLDFGVVDDAENSKTILDDIPCRGQPVEWTPGSVWESYAYHMHDNNSLPWNLIGFKENKFVVIQSQDDCLGSLFSEKERNQGSCDSCFSLLNSDDLQRFISCAHHEAKPHTPWKYLNQQQLTQLLVKSQKKVDDLHLKVCSISESSRVYLPTSLSASKF